MHYVFSLICGLIFGIGLLISDMANPLKVQNFLDLFGTWDPSLAFVMGGAIAVSAPGYWLIQKRKEPFFASTFQMPSKTDFDKNLILGSSIFGIGWGLGGFCPGPALTATSMSFIGASTNTLIFVAAMLVGIIALKMLRPTAA